MSRSKFSIGVRFASPLLFAALVFLMFNCLGKAVAGGKCSKAGDLRCSDPASALYCSAGTYQTVSCRGPKGCTGSATMGYACDDDLASVGDGCLPSTNANYACGTDHKSQLVCKDAKWAMNKACKGPNACTVKNDSISCDNTIADVGDPCTTGTYGCTTDHTALLHCVSDKFVDDNSCRGPKQCIIKTVGVKQEADCDDTIANEGDPCDEPNELTCGSDGKSELKCVGGKYTHNANCKTSCLRTGNNVNCH
jgi:hypothetical protein